MEQKTGVELIAQERSEQMKKWSEQHDCEHTLGELAKVAATLAVERTDALVIDPTGFIEDRKDPWGLIDKYKENTVQNTIKRLTIAGALIAAEIDRIQVQEK